MDHEHSNKIMEMIERHEGRERFLYKDSRGIYTIGIGHNIQYNGLSDAAIDFIFQEDIAEVLQDAQTFPWFGALDPVRQAAIIDMLFNMGLPVFRQFRKTIAYMSRGEYDSAGEEILRGSRPDGKSHYYAQVGPRAVRISKMLKTGEYQ